MFLLVSCFSCEGFQVQQRTKSNKWACRRCNQRQSVMKIHYQSHSAAECRKVLTEVTYRIASKEDEKKMTPWYLKTDFVVPPMDVVPSGDNLRNAVPFCSARGLHQDDGEYSDNRTSSEHNSEPEPGRLSRFSSHYTGKRIGRDWGLQHCNTAPHAKRSNTDPIRQKVISSPESSRINDKSDSLSAYDLQNDKRYIATSTERSAHVGIHNTSHSDSKTQPITAPVANEERLNSEESRTDTDNAWQSDAWGAL